ncbi:MAG: WecB/TagA/CpsF family glycosyltransferase [Parcubacteria group bacterium]|jgi:N-acetylglucosaminyldiphosphoundecaprenol N-acetyl-beta-D-mannosaminyltransferase
MHILNIKIDNLTKKEILQKVRFFLSEEKFHQIATINPEFILEAQKNEEFKNILNNCDLNVADGIGIKFAFWRYGKRLKCRMAGADLMKRIIRLAHENKLTIFLAANSEGLSSWEETRDEINRLYPELIVDGDNIDPKDDAYQILSSSCQIVFCNFGAPYQENFLKRQKNDRIRLAMGVGGSFDFLTQKVHRAPMFLRFVGLEWLWRLFQKPDPGRPRRWKRILRAVIIFPIKIIFN